MTPRFRSRLLFVCFDSRTRCYTQWNQGLASILFFKTWKTKESSCTKLTLWCSNLRSRLQTIHVWSVLRTLCQPPIFTHTNCSQTSTPPPKPCSNHSFMNREMTSVCKTRVAFPCWSLHFLLWTRARRMLIYIVMTVYWLWTWVGGYDNNIRCWKYWHDCNSKLEWWKWFIY